MGVRENEGGQRPGGPGGWGLGCLGLICAVLGEQTFISIWTEPSDSAVSLWAFSLDHSLVQLVFSWAWAVQDWNPSGQIDDCDSITCEQGWDLDLLWMKRGRPKLDFLCCSFINVLSRQECVPAVVSGVGVKPFPWVLSRPVINCSSHIRKCKHLNAVGLLHFLRCQWRSWDEIRAQLKPVLHTMTWNSDQKTSVVKHRKSGESQGYNSTPSLWRYVSLPCCSYYRRPASFRWTRLYSPGPPPWSS